MKKLNTLICALTLTCATLSHAGLITIVSGSNTYMDENNLVWRATDVQPTEDQNGKKWFELGYDDSSWIDAYAPYPRLLPSPGNIPTPDSIYDNAGPGSFSGSRDAELMWYWGNTEAPTGYNGTIEAYFRLEFSVSSEPGYYPVIESANTLIIADDYFELYLNGIDIPVQTGLLTENREEGQQPEPVELDLMTACVGGCIHSGDNVLAIYAYDGYGFNESPAGPQDRIYEWLFFHSEIEFTQVQVPEPGNISLFAIGLLGLVLSRKLARS